VKKLMLALTVFVLLTTTAIPSFADGDPWPRKSTTTSCPATGCLAPN